MLDNIAGSEVPLEGGGTTLPMKRLSMQRERFELQQWARAGVNIDYHVEFEQHYYSVPYTLTGQEVEIRATMTTVEVFHRGERVASHLCSHQPYHATTKNEHRPKSHQQHLAWPPLAWPPSRLLHWAQSVGPTTAQLFKAILESKPHPEMGYRSCLGILRVAQTCRFLACLRSVIATYAYMPRKTLGTRAGACAPKWCIMMLWH
jgi:hypothetical protein